MEGSAMSVNYSPGLVDYYGRLAEEWGAEAEEDALKRRLVEDLGYSDYEARMYISRRYGSPPPEDPSESS